MGNFKRTIRGIDEISKKGQDYSYYVPCKKDIKVTASGFYDLESHFKTKKHAENLAISTYSSNRRTCTSHLKRRTTLQLQKQK